MRGSKSRSKLNKKESEVKPKRPCVYILCNKPNGTLYVGVTSDLQSRIYQHKNKTFSGFTAKYNVSRLAYFEFFETMEEAILREKQLKGGSRAKKIALILSVLA
nr:GIY-YIG nuclease family protein [Campylobacter upsaliensis]